MLTAIFIAIFEIPFQASAWTSLKLQERQAPWIGQIPFQASAWTSLKRPGRAPDPPYGMLSKSSNDPTTTT